MRCSWVANSYWAWNMTKFQFSVPIPASFGSFRITSVYTCPKSKELRIEGDLTPNKNMISVYKHDGKTRWETERRFTSIGGTT
jgi:hypothetical protein